MAVVSLLMAALGVLACQPATLGDGSTSVGDGASTDAGSTDGGSSDAGTTDGGSDGGATTDGGTGGDTGTAATVGLVVNELMADNSGVVLDPDGQASDWIELYNTGDSALDLGGYGITDDWTDPFQHVLPDDTWLEAGAWLLLWADGSKKAVGEHLPFRLSADGEAVGIFAPDGSSVDWVVFPSQAEDTALARLPDGSDSWESLPLGTPGSSNRRLVEEETEVVAAGSVWTYWDGAEGPGDDWAQRGFDDSDWPSGAAPLGYGDPVSTIISYGDNPNDKHITAWFRITFAVEDDATELTDATLQLRRDDGAAVYLDGVEIARSNLPTGVLTADTPASGTTADETSYLRFPLGPLTLSPGDAVLAVEVHQASGTSSDLGMDASLTVVRIVEED